MGIIQNSKGEMGLLKFKNKIKMILKFRIYNEINPKIKIPISNLPSLIIVLVILLQKSLI